VLIHGLQFLADTFKSPKLEDAAEFGRIGRYYAIEDMLTTDPSEKYAAHASDRLRMLPLGVPSECPLTALRVPSECPLIAL
jgi:hypothetical protein